MYSNIILFVCLSVRNMCIKTIFSTPLLVHFLFHLRVDILSLSIYLSLSAQSHVIITPISSHQLRHRGDLEQQAVDWLLC